MNWKSMIEKPNKKWEHELMPVMLADGTIEEQIFHAKEQGAFSKKDWGQWTVFGPGGFMPNATNPVIAWREPDAPEPAPLEPAPADEITVDGVVYRRVVDPKYKVGQRVWVLTEIDEYDESDEKYPICVFGDEWVEAENIKPVEEE